MKNYGFLSLVLLMAAANVVSSCSGKKVNEGNPQELYQDAEEDVKDKRYLVALDKLKSLKNKFPYSHLATAAQIRVADVYYLSEQYIEAAGAYESFRDMHPKHDKADYVMFRIGESYRNQLPDTVDRDLGPATKAIDAYRELLTVYPKSQYAEEAKKNLAECIEELAQKEKYIADFYYKQEMYDSAAARYEKITSRFPESSIEQYAYWRWAQSLVNDKRNDEAKHVYRVYISRYPSGEYTRQAGDWLDQNGGR